MKMWRGHRRRRRKAMIMRKRARKRIRRRKLRRRRMARKKAWAKKEWQIPECGCAILVWTNREKRGTGEKGKITS